MTFTLDTSTLSGGQFRTQAISQSAAGEFREIQFHFSQSSLDQDMEPHFFEVHYTIAGVSHEATA